MLYEFDGLLSLMLASFANFTTNRRFDKSGTIAYGHRRLSRLGRLPLSRHWRLRGFVLSPLIFIIISLVNIQHHVFVAVAILVIWHFCSIEQRWIGELAKIVL